MVYWDPLRRLHFLTKTQQHNVTIRSLKFPMNTLLCFFFGWCSPSVRHSSNSRNVEGWTSVASVTVRKSYGPWKNDFTWPKWTRNKRFFEIRKDFGWLFVVHQLGSGWLLQVGFPVRWFITISGWRFLNIFPNTNSINSSYTAFIHKHVDYIYRYPQHVVFLLRASVNKLGKKSHTFDLFWELNQLASLSFIHKHVWVSGVISRETAEFPKIWPAKIWNQKWTCSTFSQKLPKNFPSSPASHFLGGYLLPWIANAKPGACSTTLRNRGAWIKRGGFEHGSC